MFAVIVIIVIAGNYNHDRPWFLLITDFATNTTLHGLRYLVEPTRFIARRYWNTLNIAVKE